MTISGAFNGILKDIAAAEVALERIDKQFEEAKKERDGHEQEWTDIIRRRAALGSDGESAGDGGDTSMARITDLVRRYGPMAAKRFGISGAAGAAGATWLADDGAFAGIIAKIGQLF